MQPPKIAQLAARIGLRIFEIRRERGMTQAEVAALVGVEPRHYRRYEKGDVSIDAAQMLLLAQVFHVHPRELLVKPKRSTKRLPGRPRRSK